MIIIGTFLLYRNTPQQWETLFSNEAKNTSSGLSGRLGVMPTDLSLHICTYLYMYVFLTVSYCFLTGQLMACVII